MGDGVGGGSAVRARHGHGPERAPLPPHITLKQARNFMGVMLKGEPEVGSVLANTARELVGAILPGKER